MQKHRNNSNGKRFYKETQAISGSIDVNKSINLLRNEQLNTSCCVVWPLEPEAFANFECFTHHYSLFLLNIARSERLRKAWAQQVEKSKVSFSLNKLLLFSNSTGEHESV